jgi:hypothetical protein
LRFRITLWHLRAAAFMSGLLCMAASPGIAVDKPAVHTVLIAPGGPFMEVRGRKERGVPLFLHAASDDDRRSDRQMSDAACAF